MRIVVLTAIWCSAVVYPLMAQDRLPITERVSLGRVRVVAGEAPTLSWTGRSAIASMGSRWSRWAMVCGTWARRSRDLPERSGPQELLSNDPRLVAEALAGSGLGQVAAHPLLEDRLQAALVMRCLDGVGG